MRMSAQHSISGGNLKIAKQAERARAFLQSVPATPLAALVQDRAGDI
jgi:hypothetical protein